MVRIAFTNASARRLLFADADVEGQNFIAMLEQAPAPLRHALQVEDDALVALDGGDGASETFFVSKRVLHAEAARYVLVAVKPVTEPFARQEIATLKRIIRVIGHEVNNSLGPIASLMSSARLILWLAWPSTRSSEWYGPPATECVPRTRSRSTSTVG